MRPGQGSVNAEAVEHFVQAVIDAPPSMGFVDLATKVAGLDPARDFRFGDWSGIDFQGSNLRGFDFTGSNLVGCRFKEAKIAGARFDGAQVDRSELQAAMDWKVHFRAWRPQPHPPRGEHLPDLAVFSDAPFTPEMIAISEANPAMQALVAEGTVQSGGLAVSARAITQGDLTAINIWRTKAAYPVFIFGDNKALTSISWGDATEYVDHLSRHSGQKYRIMTHSEWAHIVLIPDILRKFIGLHNINNIADLYKSSVVLWILRKKKKMPTVHSYYHGNITGRRGVFFNDQKLIDTTHSFIEDYINKCDNNQPNTPGLPSEINELGFRVVRSL